MPTSNQIEVTVFFGVVSTDRGVDIMYPIHSKTDLDRAQRESTGHGLIDYGDLRVIVYVQRPFAPEKRLEFLQTALQVALGFVPGSESPRYHFDGGYDAKTNG